MRKTIKTAWALLALALGLSVAAPSWAQIDDKYKDYREVYRDTVTAQPRTEIVAQKDTLIDPQRVMSNSFGRNWFVYGTVGAHSFRGDYSSWGPFWGTVTPDVSIGFGKWFIPGLALKVEAIYSNSRGYTEFMNANEGYGYGGQIGTHDGTPYRRMKTPWIDLGALVSLNLSRLFNGYEGYGSDRMMGQWMANIGFSGIHHFGYNHAYGSDNEWAGHFEIQYSQFFNKNKRVSLDIKARDILYQTNHDLQYGQRDRAAHKFDNNLGLDIGFTFYLGNQRNNGWSTGAATMYRNEYREREIQVVKVKEEEVIKPKNAKHGILSFYVFYPNNYSGRNDAPLIEDAPVNALDYLAGGIFTQKQYANNEAVKERMKANASLNGLQAVDLPTEAANQDFAIDFVPRGYEMLTDTPISLSLKNSDMQDFEDKTGYYYAPIWDGLNVWQYRIDDATLRQQLLSGQNYTETNSYGLNAHSGLELIRNNMGVDANDELVSFADVYAALKSNEGYISRFTDEATVARVRQILDEGIVLLIQVEGLATSQDNYSGNDAKRIGTERNTALSQNRANTVISWLKQDPSLKDASSQIYLVGNMNGGIRTVTDKSTRGLNAKLGRCVKVRIQYMMQ